MQKGEITERFARDKSLVERFFKSEVGLPDSYKNQERLQLRESETITKREYEDVRSMVLLTHA